MPTAVTASSTATARPGSAAPARGGSPLASAFTGIGPTRASRSSSRSRAICSSHGTSESGGAAEPDTVTLPQVMSPRVVVQGSSQCTISYSPSGTSGTSKSRMAELGP